MVSTPSDKHSLTVSVLIHPWLSYIQLWTFLMKINQEKRFGAKTFITCYFHFFISKTNITRRLPWGGQFQFSRFSSDIVRILNTNYEYAISVKFKCFISIGHELNLASLAPILFSLRFCLVLSYCVCVFHFGSFGLFCCFDVFFFFIF